MDDGSASADFEGPVTITDGGSALSEALLLSRGTAVDRYIVADLIGRGGMGVVYKAFDPELNRLVALKLLSIKRSDDQSSQDFAIHKTRLLREAQALAQLSHPNVVTVFDVGTHGEAVFMAMEFVEGKNLAEILAEQTPARDDLLKILRAAGQGLSAAHQVGIVHRDFKPANVILGRDGRVRVIDFGLARGATDGPEVEGAEELPEEMPSATEPSGSLAALDGRKGSAGRPSSSAGTAASSGGQQSLLATSLTQSGAIVGTPQYMAPEQHLAQQVDAKSDQFSFCVVLFEVLYGQRPFSGRSLHDLVNLVSQGKIKRPAAHDVPAWLDRIAVKGLSVAPAERYGSMAALLADLENDPAIAQAKARGRRLRWAAAVLVAGFAGAGGWGVWYGLTLGGRLCRGGEERLAGVWDDGVRGKIREAFQKTRRSYAADTFARAGKVLDEYTRAWVAMRQDACEASHLRGEQSDQLLDLRMRCLDRRLGEVRALTELFAARADPGVVDKAVEAAQGLINLATCADEKALLSDVPLPEDPAIRVRVAAIQKRLDEAAVLEMTGKLEEGLKLAERTREEAEQVGYQPALGEALQRVGSLLMQAGRYPEAERVLRKAELRAEASGLDRLRAIALNDLIYVVGYRQARIGEAERMAEDAFAVIERIRDEGEIKARTLNNVGLVLFEKGEADRALEHHLRALEIMERALGPSHLAVGACQNNIGLAYYRKGGYDQALRHHERALAIREAALGPEHPEVARSQNNIGGVYFQMRDYDKALVHFEAALKINERVLGHDHPDVGMSYNNIGAVYLLRGSYDRALEMIGIAMKIWERSLGPKHPNVADSYLNIGAILDEKGEVDQALEKYGKAVEIWEATLGPEHPLLAGPLSNIGIIKLKRKDPATARKLFERVLAICSADRCCGEGKDWVAKAQFGLARVLCPAGGNCERAIALARQARDYYRTLGSGAENSMRAEVDAWLVARGAKGE